MKTMEMNALRQAMHTWRRICLKRYNLSWNAYFTQESRHHRISLGIK